MRSATRSGRWTAVLLAAGLVLAGCGGDDGDGETGDTTGETTGGTTGETAGDTTGDTADTGSAKDDYITAADSICVAYSDEINAIPEPTTDAEFEQAALQAVDLTRQELDELRALEMPEGDGETITAIYDAVDEALDQIEADPMVLRGTVNPLAEAQQMAADYGFQVCGQG